MTIKDVMTKEVVTCKPETNLAAVAALFWENNCGAMPVMDDNGKVIGMLTDRHVCIAIGTRNRKPSSLTAGEIMESTVVIADPADHVRTAVHLMREAKVRRLPVVANDGTLTGIVSIDDIVMNVQRGYGQVDAISYGEMLHCLQAIITTTDRKELSQAAAA